MAVVFVDGRERSGSDVGVRYSTAAAAAATTTTTRRESKVLQCERGGRRRDWGYRGMLVDGMARWMPQQPWSPGVTDGCLSSHRLWHRPAPSTCPWSLLYIVSPLPLAGCENDGVGPPGMVMGMGMGTFTWPLVT